MPGPGRDVLGVMLVEQHLGRLREALMDEIIAGRPRDAAAQAEAERAAMRAAWDELDHPTPRVLLGAGPSGQPSGEGGKLGQEMVLAAHRALTAIPVVGDPRLAEGP